MYYISHENTKNTQIKYKKDPKKYDLIIIGTPVWAWTTTPAIRTYLTQNKPKKVAFFCTSGGSKGKVFEDMEELSKKPLATLDLVDKKINESMKTIQEFCQKLSNKTKITKYKP